ncbi:MAG: helix-turn-helix domain-containing protein [Dehalococcoidia bacterium]|nr:helix-turn-helix domain-containing protein [Dehalococcoidia bacterium]
MAIRTEARRIGRQLPNPDNLAPEPTSTGSSTPPAVTDYLLTVEQACEMLKISRAHLYREMQQRRLRAVKIGRNRRIKASAISDYIEKLPAAARVGDAEESPLRAYVMLRAMVMGAEPTAA